MSQHTSLSRAQRQGASGPDFSHVRSHTVDPRVDYEHEADQVADLVLQEGPASGAAAPTGASRATSSSGQPLDAGTRGWMESRLGHDFSRVRVHADANAVESARSLGARAYTVGPTIVFGAGQFAPETPSGRRLLAHELVHVMQQRAAPVSSGAGIATSRVREMVQRQPAGPSAAAAQTPADKVKEAVNRLRGVHPLFIARALSSVAVDGGSAEVHKVEQVKGGKPVTSVFTLQVKVAPLGGFKAAQFEAPSAPTQSAGTQTFAMTITIGSNQAVQFPPETLARDLFHEGMHMQLYIDRAVPSWKRMTFHTERYQDYLVTARVNEDYAPLITELTAFLQRNVRGKAPAVAAREATEIVAKIVEEKYVIDVTERDVDGRKSPTTPSGRMEEYRKLTSRWLVTYVDQVGVTNHPPDQITSMAVKLARLWTHIDANAPRPPLHDAITGKYVEPQPGVVPPPAPAPMSP